MLTKKYSNTTIKKMFSFLRTFIKWMQEEGYELQPGVLEYKPNLTIVSKTVTFLKYNELMDFYNYHLPPPCYQHLFVAFFQASCVKTTTEYCPSFIDGITIRFQTFFLCQK